MEANVDNGDENSGDPDEPGPPRGARPMPGHSPEGPGDEPELPGDEPQVPGDEPESACGRPGAASHLRLAGR